ncbi:hypothetical protein MHC_00030 [Mycoplasma haemocanis str. Illinois]|uniref:Preprotein translocase subunit SecE n=1 Tax=Mycoplasma haemocanis (strain Illinois) TaxID=1111676 RepID=H6N5V7_MYCHN|nr:hypothetical protein [Mycoplasma haemocanis]AEW44872.1 hypothetical protein MHC_00030 [Mycoplasma haemocanis str. Illinois]
METDKLKEVVNFEDYSWFKVHWKNLKSEGRILVAGIVKNFKRVTWHNSKGLAVEYILVVFILLFLAIFVYLVYGLVAIIK